MGSTALIASEISPQSAADPNPPHISSSSPKRSRRSVQKRVVHVPISDAKGSRSNGGGGGGGGSPPSDSWTWRKYGQKPIKGSPYPRGYYKCSSSKGCPARKQVERSRVDPTTIVVTYACEHNHSLPVPRSHHHRSNSKAPEVEPADPVRFSPADPVRFSPASGLSETDEYRWFSVVGSTSSGSPPDDDLLVGPIASDMAMPFMEEGYELAAGVEAEEDEDSLFAGLGELPEWSVVFRRGSMVA